MHYPYAFKINRLQFDASLGVTTEEQAQPQPVELTITLHFPLPPSCALDDEATSYICYDTLASNIISYVQNHQFRFIEHMAMQVHAKCHAFLNSAMGDDAKDIRITLHLRKAKPPVQFKLDGADFIYSDLPAGCSYIV